MSEIDVLLVDQHEELICTIAERLRIRGVKVRVSHDRVSAMRLIRERQPEVMVIDLQLNANRGFELLRRVKSCHPGVEVIVTMYDGSAKERDAAIKLGACGYLEKPVELNELIDALLAVREKRSGQLAEGLPECGNRAESEHPICSGAESMESTLKIKESNE